MNQALMDQNNILGAIRCHCHSGFYKLGIMTYVLIIFMIRNSTLCPTNNEYQMRITILDRNLCVQTGPCIVCGICNRIDRCITGFHLFRSNSTAFLPIAAYLGLGVYILDDIRKCVLPTFCRVTPSLVGYRMA